MKNAYLINTLKKDGWTQEWVWIVSFHEHLTNEQKHQKYMLCNHNAEYEFPSLPGHLQLSGVRVTLSLVVCIVFGRCLFVLFFHFISHSQHSINMWNGRVCDRSGLWVAMHLCVCGFVCFDDFSISFRSCSGSVNFLFLHFMTCIYIFLYCNFILWF